MRTGKSWSITAGAVAILLVAGACRKHVPPPPPPPPPPPTPAATPSVSLTVEPGTIQRGQSATLRWSAQNAATLDLQPRIGPVATQGTLSVSPTESTTFTITARGAGGSTEATARLTVTAPSSPPPPPPAPPSLTMQQRFDRDIQDAYYDYDKAIIRSDARDNLTKSAEFLRSNPSVTITIEGHCDERGSTAYNLGLGDRRANAAKEFLVSIGISGDRIKTITYGKEKPFCTAHDETCWQQNRRAHLVCDMCGMR